MDFDAFVQRFPIPADFDEQVAAIIGPKRADEALPHLHMVTRVYLAKAAARVAMKVSKKEQRTLRRAMLIAMNQPGGRLPNWDREILDGLVAYVLQMVGVRVTKTRHTGKYAQVLAVVYDAAGIKRGDDTFKGIKAAVDHLHESGNDTPAKLKSAIESCITRDLSDVLPLLDDAPQVT